MTEQKMEFTIKDVGWEAMELFFGVDPRQLPPRQPAPTHSILIRHTDEVPAKPRKPEHVKGFTAWLKGTNRRNVEIYHRDYLRWVIAGKPATKTVEVQTYIPRATITSSNV